MVNSILLLQKNRHAKARRLRRDDLHMRSAIRERQKGRGATF